MPSSCRKNQRDGSERVSRSSRADLPPHAVARSWTDVRPDTDAALRPTRWIALVVIGCTLTVAASLTGGPLHAGPLHAGPFLPTHAATDDSTALSESELARLVPLLESDRESAVAALAPYGPPVVAQVRAALSERNGAPPTLEHVGFRALIDRVARGALRRAEEEEGSVRYHGQFAALAPLGEEGADLLLEIFASEDETISTRRTAGTALGDIGGPAQVPALEKIADDFLTELWVQEETIFLLARFGERTRIDKKIDELEEVVSNLPTAATLPAILNAHGELARMRYRTGDFDAAVRHYRAKERLLSELRDTVREELRAPIQAEIILLQYNLACSLSLSGDLDAAFAALDRSMESRDITLDMVRTDGDLRALRADSRYAAWLAGWTEKLERERAGEGSTDDE